MGYYGSKIFGGLSESELKKSAIAVFDYDETSGTTGVDSTGRNSFTRSGTFTLNQQGVIGTSLLSTTNYRMDSVKSSKFTPTLTPMSWNCWINFGTLPSGLKFLASVKSPSQVAYQWQFNSGNLQFWLGDGSTNASKYLSCSYSQSSLAMSTGNWYMFTATYNGGTSPSSLKMYFNGNVLTTTNSMVGTFTGCSYNSGLLFSDGFGVAYGILGRRDQLSVFDKELSPSDIQKLYNSGNGLPYTQF